MQSRTGHVAPFQVTVHYATSQTYAKRPSSSTFHHSVGPQTEASCEQAGGSVGVSSAVLKVVN